MNQLNVGNLDRVIRVILGIALVALTVAGYIGIWGYLGLALMATGVIALCPLYTLLGLRTTSR
ncbi:MAG: DUF2892 domain-containing protein [Caldimonas sp.]